MDNANSRIAKNTIFLYVRLIFVMLISLYSVRLVMHSLGIEDYGIYNVVAGFVVMLGFFGTTMTTAYQRYYNFEIGKHGYEGITPVFNAAIKIQVIVSLLIVVVFESFGIWYINNVMSLTLDRLSDANILFQLTLFTTIFTILAIPYQAVVISYEKLNVFAVVGIVDAGLKFIAALLIGCFDRHRLIGYGTTLLIFSIFINAYYCFYSHRFFKHIKIKSSVGREFIRPMLIFSGLTFLGGTANLGKTQGVNLLLNYFFGVIVNAANAIVTHIYSAIQTFSTNIVMAFRPQLTEAYASGNIQRSIMLMSLMSKAAYSLVFTVSVPIALKMEYILKLWLGKELPDYTSQFTLLTLLIAVIGTLHTPINQMVNAVGNIKKFQFFYSIILLLILPVGWFGFKLGYAPESIFYITIGAMVIIQIVSVYILSSLSTISVGFYFKTIISPCLLFSICMPILPVTGTLYMKEDTILNLLLFFLLSIIGAGLSCRTILSNREYTSLKSVILRCFQK